MRVILRVLLVISASAILVPAQQPPPCKEDVSRLPAYSNQEIGSSLEARFELRRCVDSDLIRVLMFERGARRAAVDFQITDSTRATYHSFNVLVTQTVGGSGSAVRVFWFKRGKAQMPVEDDTQGNFGIRHDDKGNLIVDVPPHRGRPTNRLLLFPIEVVLQWPY